MCKASVRRDEARQDGRRALAIEVGMQNAGLGAKIAGDLFPGTKGTGIPCVLFAFLCVFSATLLARWFSGRPLSVQGQDGTSINPFPSELH